MIIRETESQYIFILRPEELFDMRTLASPPETVREGRLTARSKISGEVEMIGMAYGKGYDRKWATQLAQAAGQRYTKSDQLDVARLKYKKKMAKRARAAAKT